MKVQQAAHLGHIRGIKSLQEKYLKGHRSPEEEAKEGFVTAEYTLEELEEMHRHAPSTITVADNRVVGYIIATTAHVKGKHALLDDLFYQIESRSFKGTPFSNLDYVVVGQVCIEKAHRGKGLFRAMYQHYRNTQSSSFDCCVTDISTENQRSLQAHQNIGFEVFDRMTYGGTTWDLVAWDWRTMPKTP